jgi:two-component system, OmpR family, sensor kinase
MKISLKQLFLAFSVVLTALLITMSWLMWQSLGQVKSAVAHSLEAQKTLELYRELNTATKEYLDTIIDTRTMGTAARGLDGAQLLLKNAQSRVKQSIENEVGILEDHDKDEVEDEARERAQLDRVVVLTDTAAETIKSIIDKNAKFADRGRDAGTAALRVAMSGELGKVMTDLMKHEQVETSEAIETADEQLATLTKRGMIYLAGLVVVFFVGAFFLQRVIVRPINHLHAAVHAAAKGDVYTTISFSRLVEYSALQFEFRMMLDEVRAHRERFTRDNAELELVVLARTNELSAANEKLTAADRARTRFLSDISHELRTPLTLIRGEADIGLRMTQADSADLRGALRRVKEISDQMAVLVDDLLFMSRFQDAGLRLDMGEYNLTQLMQQAVSDSLTQAQRRGVRLELVPSNEVLVAACDRARIRQALLILLDNATRYAAQNGEVEVSLSREEKFAVFKVVNDGPGINPADLPHVFERYFRGEAARLRDKSGVGIGLSIAKVIVEAHQGSITAESIPGERTTFFIKIPITGIMNATTRH